MKKIIKLANGLNQLNTSTNECSNSVNTNLASNQFVNGADADISDKIYFLVNDTLDLISERQNIQKHLEKLSKLSYFDVTLKKRPQIYKQLNFLLGALIIYHATDGFALNIMQGVITRIKNQIDDQPQNHEHLADSEWQELEKSVYLLTDWEDQILGTTQPQAYYN